MNTKLQIFQGFLEKRQLLLLCCAILYLKGSFAFTPGNQKLEDVYLSINVEGASIKEIFKTIEEKTEFTFVFDNEVTQNKQRFTLNERNKNLKALLDKITNQTGFQFKNFNNTITVVKPKVLLNKKESPQQLIEGTVLDDQGLPLLGATVREKGTSNGTNTDFDGNFSLQVGSASPVLQISFMGYVTQEVVLEEGQTAIDVQLLPDNDTLEEIVVVGYGETNRQNLSTAVSTVNTKNIDQRPVADVSSSLQGLSPGLNVTQSTGKVGAEPRINIRGFTSINGGIPLILIDGVEGNLSNLNPNDVESISVLKDAGSAAIYGARAAFGVVLVTTKNAKEGSIVVNMGTTMALNTPTMNTDFVTDPYLAVSIVDEAFRNNSGASYTGYTEADMEALLEVSQNPSLARVIIDQRNGRDQYVHYGHTDWWDTFFRKTYPTQIYTGSVSGGSEKVNAYFSYRNFQSKGILKVQDDEYQKYNLRGKLDIEATDWLSFSNNMQYNSSEDLEHGGTQYGYRDVWGSMIWVHALPSYMPTNPDGSSLWRTELNNYTIGDGIYASLLQGTSKEVTNEGGFSNIASAEIKPFASLKFNASYAIRRNNFSRFQRSTRIPYSIYPGQIDLMGYDYLNEYRTESKYDALNVYGEYRGVLGDHSLKAVLGYNQETFLTKTITTGKQNLISNELNSLGLATTNPTADGSASEWALQGLFYRLSYDYNDKYLLEFNGRYDATSRFPSAYRWGFFPSVSAGWLLNKEDFFSNVAGDAFNLFKIRASYGSLGNQNIDDYAYFPTLPTGAAGLDGSDAYAINGNRLNYIESPALNPTQITWEEVSTLNFGADIALLDNRLSLIFDWFQRDTEGMLAPGATLPAVLGAPSPLENAADLRTRGFELSLTYGDSFELGNDPFTFSVTGNLSNSKTTITRFQNPNLNLVDFYEGMTIGELWGYRIDGLFQTEEEIANHADQSFVSNRITSGGGLQPGDVKYIDLNGDGVVNEGENTVNDPGDKEIIGNTAPQYLYSFNLNTQWKGFDLSAFFQGVGKQDWYPNSDSRLFWGPYNRPYNSFIRKDLANNMWSPENTDAYFPRNYGYIALGGSLEKINDRYLQSVAYLRLKNLTFGYTLPQGVISNSASTKLRIYFSGENLLTFSPLTDYIDPEAASNAVNLNQPTTDDGLPSANRSTAQTVPFSKTYSIGVSFQF
ncbi:SusC/RagA family TonB-linked outer membrane protein [Autumnicola musiva]|uniref:SusC/RagA family TonB-linked outer membrane protein n=1 Tax=Autumnicola musiva TaxID=3075589 RepID=A0ABU3DB90_9FLAO|nr:SusC/RagA family TonB-linked outer membrane protein [Zunongwangia sp. F117]MDT0678634.1 SusC/RagA family TonB-linked outer membrane protein [Zunongwangia sp. F117]